MQAQEFNANIDDVQLLMYAITRSVNTFRDKEKKQLDGLLNGFNKMVAFHKSQLLQELQSLGASGYIEGDGILRVSKGSDRKDDAEYRVFLNTKYGTEYVGTFDRAEDARACWRGRKEQAGTAYDKDDPAFYYYVKSRGTTRLAEWVDLEEDPEIKQNVTLAAPKTGLGDSLLRDEDLNDGLDW
jgi:hypothetical protein